jgi:hypothetical protein
MNSELRLIARMEDIQHYMKDKEKLNNGQTNIR